MWRRPCTRAPGTGCASGPARLNARLIRDCSVPRVIRSPSRPTNSGDRAGQWDRGEAAALVFRFSRAGEADRAAVQVCLDDGEQFGLDGHAAFLAAFAFDVDDGGPVIGGADIADICSLEFLGAQAGKQSGED